MQQSNHLMDITSRPPQVFVRGEGSWLWDSADRRYLDFVQGWAVNCLGHSPQVVCDALTTQAGQLLSPSPAYFNQPAIDLAERIAGHSVFDQVFFANSGAEANEGAIKLARRWGKAPAGSGAPDRFEIISFKNAFHGRTLATMSASGKSAFEPLFEPKVAGFFKAELNDIESVRAQLTSRTVAVMIEPIQGEAGVIEASAAFLSDLRALTTEHNLLLIVDEIQTGVGRTGTLWAYEQAGIEPDVMTLGKGLGAGVPLAALVATDSASCFVHGDQGGTWCGNPLMAAVGCAVMDTVADPVFLKTVCERGAYLREKLHDLSARLGLGPVNGAGLLLALNVNDNMAAAVVDAALERDLLVNAPRENLLRFMPALTVSNDEIDEMTNRLGSAIAAVG